MANTLAMTTPNRSSSRTKKPPSSTVSNQANSSFEAEENEDNESDDAFEDSNNEDEGSDENSEAEDVDEDDTTYGSPKSSPAKRKAASTNTTPIKRAKTADKKKATPKPRTPKKPKQVHKAEPILSKLDKAVQKGLKKGETTLDQKTVVAILDYVSVLRKGCDEAGSTEKLFEKHYAENGGSPVEEKVPVIPLTEEQIKSDARSLSSTICYDMSKKMKWTNACRHGAAKVSTADNSGDGPEVFVKLLKLDKSYLTSKSPFSAEYTRSEFEDRFGDIPSGSARYSTLSLHSPIKVQWWPRTGRYRVSGYYGK